MQKLKFLLAGNPNVGKSTVFNYLTGMKQHVGNWPGKTVEQKSGEFEYKDYEIELIDLPGNYSLTPYSAEEQVSRDAILHEDIDGVINIIDAENLQRNLYLTLQTIETGANTMIALNMLNYAEEAGLKIDVKKLEKTLGVPIAIVDARSGEGMDDGKDSLVEKAIQMSKNPKDNSSKITYDEKIQTSIKEIEGLFPSLSFGSAPKSWIALKLLEGDDEVLDAAEQSPDKANLRQVTKMRRDLEAEFDCAVDDALIDDKYAKIDGIINDCVKKVNKNAQTLTDKIDRIVTNRWLGIPIFLIVMYVIFYLTYTIGGPWQDLIDYAFSLLIDYLTPILGDSLFTSFILNGVIGGVGSVLTFIPIIFILFFLLSFMEDIGYLARAAFVIDRIMKSVMGLNGKAFIPMILGFGCDVTGIMTTRTLANEGDRISTILALPFISCSARIPIYALFTSLFFEAYQTEVTFAMYILGMIVAVIVAKTFKSTVFKDEVAPFTMELPPYRLPTLKTATLHMWERGSLFLRKAGTIILGAAVLVWLLGNLPPGVEENSLESIIGIIGNAIAPIFAPIGFGNWQTSVALVFGMIAKEVIISTFGTIFGVGEDGLMDVLPGMFTPLSALSFMVFSLLYVPCFACLGAVKEETNSWKWLAVCVVLCVVIAYVAALVVYQGGLLLGFT
ncbi:MAG: ferrous iron transport protein B [Methanosphaera sp.]|nr:ferrous iron transport protein B [Methanosphaera sp.]